jgi:hypothetical protein
MLLNLCGVPRYHIRLIVSQSKRALILKIDTVVVTIKGYEIYVLSHFVIINNTFVGSRDIKIKRNGA